MPSGSGRRRGGFLAELAERLYGSRRRAAFTLITLAVAVTLLNIAVAAALPAWGHMIQHDKEEELIFRGLQYAEAIRVFQIRFGRFPTNLKELKDTEPRCLRQLWKNPLTEDGRWALVPAGVGAPMPGQLGGPSVPDNGLDGDEGLDGGAGGGQPGKGGAPGQGTPQVIWSEDMDEDSKIDLGKPRNNLPIRGVYSPSTLEAIHTFGGKESISEWQFTVELVSTMQQGTADNPGFVRPFPVEQIGKPWPPGVTPPLPQPTASPVGPGGGNGLNPGGGKPGSPFRGDDGSGRDLRQIPPDQQSPFQAEPDGGG